MRLRPRLLLAVVAAWLALAAGDGWREAEREFRAVGALLAVPPAELQAAGDAEAAADALEAASFPPGLDTQARGNVFLLLEEGLHVHVTGLTPRGLQYMRGT